MPIPARFRCVHCGGEARPLQNEGKAQCSRCDASFPVDQDIVVLSDATDDHDYPEELIDLVARVEHRHFWFAARNDVILSAMREAFGRLTGKRVLDVGCGTGFVTAALERAGMDVWGVDMHLVSLKRARQRVTGPLFASQSPVLPFFADFDGVTLLDVIEHLDDDVSALREAAAVLRPGGVVIVTVPAGPDLWTSYDEVIGHKRRYERDTLADVLRAAGLEVRDISYFNCLLLLPQVVQRWWAPGLRSTTHDSNEIVRHTLKVPPEPLNTLLRWSIRIETPLRSLRWVRGGSLLAIARPRR